VGNAKRGMDMIPGPDRNSVFVYRHHPFAIHDIVIFVKGIGSGFGVGVDTLACARRNIKDHEIGRVGALVKAEITGTDRAITAIEIGQVLDDIGFVQDAVGPVILFNIYIRICR
jgi:hypothetical protein